MHSQNFKLTPAPSEIALQFPPPLTFEKPIYFQAHVSPHEMLQAVVLCSKKNFQITKQGDAVEFLKWLLNALHLALGGTKKHTSSIIYKSFR
jgi:U4/U6.U5 tri-snRNP-associated protein 2